MRPIQWYSNLFFARLARFSNLHNIFGCRESGGGLSGTCLSEADIAELWRLHYEVTILCTRGFFNLYM